MNWSKVKSCMYYEKAESEGQRGKPRGTLESEIRSATSLRCDIAPGVAPIPITKLPLLGQRPPPSPRDSALRAVLSLFFPGANLKDRRRWASRTRDHCPARLIGARRVTVRPRREGHRIAPARDACDYQAPVVPRERAWKAAAQRR